MVNALRGHPAELAIIAEFEGGSNPRFGLSRYALQPSARVGGCLGTPARLTTDVGGPSSALRVLGVANFARLAAAIDDPESRLPETVRGPGHELLEQISILDAKIGKLDKEVRKRVKESDEAKRHLCAGNSAISVRNVKTWFQVRCPSGEAGGDSANCAPDKKNLRFCTVKFSLIGSSLELF